MKAKFTIELSVPDGYQAYSNMPAEKDNEEMVIFAETPIMPNYGVAFAITKYKFLPSYTEKGTPFRTFYLEKDLHLVKYASELGPNILTKFENMF